jgi:uncharacterized protein YndB with AHSA1/START domain
MAMTTAEQTVQSINIVKEIDINAPIEIAFEALLEELGPANVMGGNKPMPMVIEARPGGRWYRDLGGSAGHFWGHVQVIKAPALLEICGPLFMSFPASNHVQYRLTSEGDVTRLKLTHGSIGLFPDQLLENMRAGWESINGRIRDNAERRARARK